MALSKALLRSPIVRLALLLAIVVGLLAPSYRRWQVLEDERKDLKYYQHFQDPPSYDSFEDSRRILRNSSLYSDVSNAQGDAQKAAAVEELCAAHHFPVWKQPARRFYDLIMVSGELDMLEVRLNTLAPYVDYFVIVETNRTFTGLPKPMVLQNKDNWARFKDFHHKIIYKVVDDPSPYTDGNQWDHEIFLRNSMLTHTFPDLEGTEKAAKKGDVILVSDLDELIKPETAMVLQHCDFPKRLTIRSNFAYYSYTWKHRGADWDHPQATTYGGSVKNTLVPEALRKELWDPRLAEKSHFKVLSLEEKLKKIGQESGTIRDAGWHCSSCFNTIEQVIDKLNGFSHREFNSKENRNPQTILDRYKNGLDLFGRPEEEFAFDRIPADDVPEYVLNDKSGRLHYLIDRNSTYAGFIDAEEMIKNPPA